MLAGGASGAGTANQVRPPSTVLRITIVRQLCTWSAHGVVSSQPVDTDTKLADRTVSARPPRPGAGAGELDCASAPLAVPGAERLAPTAGTAAARPQAAAVTSSAAVITKAGHVRSARRRAVPEPT